MADNLNNYKELLQIIAKSRRFFFCELKAATLISTWTEQLQKYLQEAVPQPEVPAEPTSVNTVFTPSDNVPQKLPTLQ